MDVLILIISTVLFFLCLSICTFLLIRNLRDKTSIYLAGLLFFGAFYIVFWVLGELSVSESNFILFRRSLYIPAELGTLFWFLASFSIREIYDIISNGLKIIKQVITGLNLVLVVLIVFTNLLVRYNAVYSVSGNGGVEWYDPVTSLYIFRLVVNLVKLFFPILNFYFLAKVDPERISEVDKGFFRKFAEVSVLLFTGGMIGMVWHYVGEGLWEIHGKVLLLSVGLMLVGTVYGCWALLYYNTLLEQKEAIHKEVLVNLLRNLISSVALVGVIFLVYKVVEIQMFFFFLVFIVITFVVLNNGLGETLKQMALDSIRNRKFSIPVLNLSDLNILMKIFVEPQAVNESKALMAPAVMKYARTKKITNQEALSEILRQSIEFFRPIEEGEKRT
ncbi:MAG: hypothetical protein ABIE03_06365 [Patescibacteria group bacterium]|nr:hypothetical protein [Patescibacteria group bacterium]